MGCGLSSTKRVQAFVEEDDGHFHTDDLPGEGLGSRGGNAVSSQATSSGGINGARVFGRTLSRRTESRVSETVSKVQQALKSIGEDDLPLPVLPSTYVKEEPEAAATAASQKKKAREKHLQGVFAHLSDEAIAAKASPMRRSDRPSSLSVRARIVFLSISPPCDVNILVDLSYDSPPSLFFPIPFSPMLPPRC